MPTIFDEADHTCVIDTPKAVSVNVAGTYILRLDVANLAADDVLIMRAKVRARSGGTTRLLWEDCSDDNPQTWPIWDSLPVPMPLAVTDGLIFEFEQTDGTGRVIPYAVIAL